MDSAGMDRGLMGAWSWVSQRYSACPSRLNREEIYPHAQHDTCMNHASAVAVLSLDPPSDRVRYC